MNLFGKKKPAAPKPTTESAIHQLNESIATIDKREQHLTSRIDALHKEAAVKLKKNDKKGALNIMKRAKMLEADVNKLQGTRQNLELQISTLESAAMNARVVDSFKASTTALKNINGGMDADQAFDIMDEMKEAKDMAKELQDVISEVPTEYEYEDDELLRELQDMELEQEATPAQAQPASQPATQQSVFNFPDAPATQVQIPQSQSTQESEDEAALRELQASMMA
mmetsp:Transcript_25011/g.36930  ORF Transcript_25011/g.36930 Transcript_25011/m.36930 type:complete len:226 (+) Transcript_25011:139-816(+)|eukprot:CAMPEP_0185024270 /NCGR_PEP_ID=MMETSP1103-20130426/7272_1 /TAXON_ID=36769 /ORGANISM="Paraphysomonas bandaiensis, Strain Caron Lab Isolate" /LENGTH=225 /DNA_ID=CAMNT_0027557191 /DNA_START=89 /DNA_END=766 /DNA_ORIENTATION=-